MVNSSRYCSLAKEGAGLAHTLPAIHHFQPLLATSSITKENENQRQSTCSMLMEDGYVRMEIREGQPRYRPSVITYYYAQELLYVSINKG